MKPKKGDLLNIILKEITNNSLITEKKIGENYGYSERTIRRYFKILKDNNIIVLERNGSKRKWKIINKNSYLE